MDLSVSSARFSTRLAGVFDQAPNEAGDAEGWFVVKGAPLAATSTCSICGVEVGEQELAEHANSCLDASEELGRVASHATEAIQEPQSGGPQSEPQSGPTEGQPE
jgi:hypothetical protein